MNIFALCVLLGSPKFRTLEFVLVIVGSTFDLLGGLWNLQHYINEVVEQLVFCCVVSWQFAIGNYHPR